MSDYAPDEATARADLCRFLSACYYEPAPEFAEENLFDSLLVATRQVHPDLAEQARKLGEAFASQDLQTLLVDYTRLFLGPMQALASPYGSAWLNTPVPTEGNPPLAVLDLYSEGGFDMDADFRELPDHVAVELEFLYLLTFNKNHADAAGVQNDSATTPTTIAALRERFLHEHLGAWIGPFAAAVKANA
ncbi:MAG: molecular chaperone TorD family protein, partial [Gammaproteobacteria bacterium]|nr:molecular chaperone TorD family protein [Gammaproteobacteria bacterium]